MPRKVAAALGYDEAVLLALMSTLLLLAANDPTPQALETRCQTERHAPSCYKLGFMHSVAMKVAKDLPRAAALFKQACDLGNAPGCHDLGLMYERGNGMAKDQAKAEEMYAEEIRLTEKACRAGQEFPCKLLEAWRAKGWIPRPTIGK